MNFARSYCNSYSQASIIREELGQWGVKDKAITVWYDRVHALQYRSRGSFPLQAPLIPVELKPVGEVLGLCGGANQHHGGKELGVAFIFLLLPEHKQKMVTQARMHYYPICWCREVHVCGQENNLCPMKDVDPVRLSQMWNHHFYMAFPLTRKQRAHARNQLRVVHCLEGMVGMKAALLRGGLTDCMPVWYILQEEEKKTRWKLRIPYRALTWNILTGPGPERCWAPANPIDINGSWRNSAPLRSDRPTMSKMWTCTDSKRCQ